MVPKKESLDREFYFGEKADFYAKSKWMERNQIKSTARALALLEDSRMGGELSKSSEHLLVLDLGCGTGFSSHIIESAGFHMIGLDNSFDMLEKHIEKSAPNKRNLVCGMIEALPFRKNTFNVMISISAFNFILDKKLQIDKKRVLNEVANLIYEILEPNGRVVIEFYPKKVDIPLYMETLKQYFEGGLIIDNPNQRKEQKFLILRQKRPDKKIAKSKIF
ncbi:MAG: class I SAM-dependent methyltransferase [Promethearchaeota archaeon]|nr:MAG: class I SAM-dependent methyltransferase [Candidatus Lokiarchaeota archaeon]